LARTRTSQNRRRAPARCSTVEQYENTFHHEDHEEHEVYGQEDDFFGARFKPALLNHLLRELRVLRGLPDFHLVAALPR
jgi:hypothetical protein